MWAFKNRSRASGLPLHSSDGGIRAASQRLSQPVRSFAAEPSVWRGFASGSRATLPSSRRSGESIAGSPREVTAQQPVGVLVGHPLQRLCGSQKQSGMPVATVSWPPRWPQNGGRPPESARLTRSLSDRGPGRLSRAVPPTAGLAHTAGDGRRGPACGDQRVFPVSSHLRRLTGSRDRHHVSVRPSNQLRERGTGHYVV